MTETDTHETRRFASLLVLIGAALLIVGNATHPIDANPTATSRLALATTGSWIAVHLVVAVGLLAVVGGLALLPRAIAHPRGNAYARLGAVAAIVGGGTLAVVFGAVDGYGFATLATAAQGANGTDRAAIETVALAIDTLDSGMTAIGVLALFGIAIASFGAAFVTSRIVPIWLGWVALLIALAGTVTGLLLATLGPTALVINLLFRPVALVTTLYFVALAVTLRRPAPEARPPRAGRAGT